MDWITVLIVSIIIFILGFMVYTKQWDRLKEIALTLMLQAERYYDNSQGKQKFDEVFNRLYYDHMPDWLKIFVSQEYIINMIQYWYDEAKSYLIDSDT